VALQGLAHPVRVALLAFLEGRKPSHVERPTAENTQTETAALALQDSHALPCDLGRQDPLPHCKKPGVPGPKNKSGCPGVFQDRSGYRAMVFFCNLRMFCGACQSIERAISNHAMLVAVKQIVLETEDHANATLGNKIRNALDSVCSEREVSIDDLALSYRAKICVAALTGGLTSVDGLVTADLDNALEQRDLLLSGKKDGWHSFREAWIQILTKSRTKTRDRAERFVDSVWAKHAPKRVRREERQRLAEDRRAAREKKQRWCALNRRRPTQSQVARAVQAVEKCLNAEQFRGKRKVYSEHKKQ